MEVVICNELLDGVGRTGVMVLVAVTDGPAVDAGECVYQSMLRLMACVHRATSTGCSARMYHFWGDDPERVGVEATSKRSRSLVDALSLAVRMEIEPLPARFSSSW